MTLGEQRIEGFAAVLRIVVRVFLVLTNIGIMAMVLITCADILMRLLGHSIIGAYDMVRIAGTLAMACALPYTTAVKGHVAIEYFFQKLNLKGRNLVDRVLNLIGISFFSLLGYKSVRVGVDMKIRDEVTATLQVPIFWVLWIIALCCFLVALVIFYNFLQPRKELIRP